MAEGPEEKGGDRSRLLHLLASVKLPASGFSLKRENAHSSSDKASYGNRMFIPCLQKPATWSCPESDESTPHSTCLRSILVLSSHSRTLFQDAQTRKFWTSTTRRASTLINTFSLYELGEAKSRAHMRPPRAGLTRVYSRDSPENWPDSCGAER